MAEPTSLVFGAIGLAGLFNSCVCIEISSFDDERRQVVFDWMNALDDEISTQRSRSTSLTSDTDSERSIFDVCLSSKIRPSPSAISQQDIKSENENIAQLPILQLFKAVQDAIGYTVEFNQTADGERESLQILRIVVKELQNFDEILGPAVYLKWTKFPSFSEA